MLELTFACALYDRMVPLYAGRVHPEGIDLTFLAEEDIRSTFDRMGRDQAFDLSEMSGSELVTRLDAGGSPLVAIPVWPSRAFRHGFIFVRRAAGIRSPKDLEGRRIGVPLYTMSAAVWIRGMLREDYGVDFGEVTWVQGALDKPGAHGNPTLPPGLSVPRLEKNASAKTLFELLCDGEIDAIVSATLPEHFGATDAAVRLFENYGDVEVDYYRRTGIFPIMHMVALRRDRYDAHPFIGQSLYAAFERSKELAYEGLNEIGALRVLMPLLPYYWEATKRVFGDDPWPYGVEANRPTLEALVRYLRHDGLISRAIPIEELFVS
jgi:4,5-dihydroxyphthalate decarboxylase